MRRRQILTAFIGAVFAATGLGNDASAQRVVGCFYQGRQVADSACAAGGSSSGSNYSGGGGIFYKVGGAIVQTLMGGFSSNDDDDAAVQAAVAQRRQSVAFNNQGVELANQGRRAEAIEKYKLAIQYDATNAVAHANYFLERAQLSADRGMLDDALLEAKIAVDVSLQSQDGRAKTLAISQQSVRFLEQALGQRQADRKQEFANQQQQTFGQLRPLGGGDLTFESKRGSFGATELKPRELQVDNTPRYDNRKALDQANSAAQSGTYARDIERTDDQAKRRSGCTFDGPGCDKPAALAAIAPATGVPTGNTANTEKLLQGIPERFRSRSEIKGWADQYNLFDKQAIAKQQEIDRLRAELSTGKSADSTTLNTKVQMMETDKGRLIRLRDDTKVRMDEKLRSWDLKFDEKKPTQ